MGIRAIFILFLFSSIAYANQGRLIVLSKDGALTGLPKSYQPATFDLKSNTFQIGKNKLKNFDSCISRFLPAKKKYKLDFSASWEHRENAIFPPYITIRVIPEGATSARYFSYSLSFELDTLKQISSYHLEPSPGSNFKLNQLIIPKECK